MANEFAKKVGHLVRFWCYFIYFSAQFQLPAAIFLNTKAAREAKNQSYLIHRRGNMHVTLPCVYVCVCSQAAARNGSIKIHLTIPVKNVRTTRKFFFFIGICLFKLLQFFVYACNKTEKKVFWVRHVLACKANKTTSAQTHVRISLPLSLESSGGKNSHQLIDAP